MKQQLAERLSQRGVAYVAADNKYIKQLAPQANINFGGSSGRLDVLNDYRRREYDD